MSLFEKSNLLFDAKVPELEKYIGRMIRIPGVIAPVKIETICGNIGLSIGREKAKPQFYEINGEHLIGMLRFHAQMENAKDITEEQMRDFEAIEFEAEKLPPPKLPMEK